MAGDHSPIDQAERSRRVVVERGRLRHRLVVPRRVAAPCESADRGERREDDARAARRVQVHEPVVLPFLATERSVPKEGD